ncbi:MAG: YceI family protein [Flavobacteriaceae bacterium]
MKKILLFTLILTLPTVASAQKSLNIESSNLKWTGEEITTKQHYGSLKFKSGSLTFENEALVGGTFVVDMTTLKNKDLSGQSKEYLEGHLKSDDFFSVEKYPEATLVVTKGTALENGGYNVQGDLTIKGKTHPAVFELSPENGQWVALLTFDRAKYDVQFRSGSFFQNLGDKLIYDEIKLEARLVFNN